MDREDKRGIFFGVVGVLTLIVAIIGASLAYFSINVRSKDDAITVQAATVKIVYETGTHLNVKNIIPSSRAVAVTTLDRYLGDSTTYKKCVDDRDQVVCGSYNYTIINEGRTSTTVKMVVKPTEITVDGEPIEYNKFKNLSYILYDVSKLTYSQEHDEYIGTITEEDIVAEGVFNSESTGTGNDVVVSENLDTLIIDNLPIAANEEKNYRLFIWLNEAGEQDYEQGAMFQAAVSIEVLESNGTITGIID